MKKIVLITGCASGLGEELAKTLANKGYIIYASSRNLKDLKVEGELICPIMLDITSNKDCKLAVEKIISEEGRIDVLINNAAYTLAGPTIEFESQEYLEILNINAVGAFRLIKEVYPYMKGKKSGKIINITSFNGLVSLPNFGLYSSSKFAMEALGLSLRYELAEDGICVTNVAPGAISIDRQKRGKTLPHRTAREKFWILRILMPMISRDAIVRKVENIIENSSPPARVVLGRDAKITTFLQRCLPSVVWDRLMRFVWNKK